MKARNWIVALLCLASSAWAEPFTNNYGKGQTNPVGVDELKNGYVLIKDKNQGKYQNNEPKFFLDSFQFKDLSFASIDYFTLTLNYSGIGTTAETENWQLAWYLTPEVTLRYDLPASPSKTEVTLTIGKDLSAELKKLVSTKEFTFGFFETTKQDDEFSLYSATLAIYGKTAEVTPPTVPTTPTNGVPEPASLALLGVALAGLGVLRRRPRCAS